VRGVLDLWQVGPRGNAYFLSNRGGAGTLIVFAGPPNPLLAALRRLGGRQRFLHFGAISHKRYRLVHIVASVMTERLLRPESSAQKDPFVTSDQPSAALSTRAERPVLSVTA